MKTEINTLVKYRLDANWNIYILSKLPFRKYKIAIDYRSKMSKFTWKEPARHLPNEVLKVNISNNGTD